MRAACRPSVRPLCIRESQQRPTHIAPSRALSVPAFLPSFLSRFVRPDHPAPLPPPSAPPPPLSDDDFCVLAPEEQMRRCLRLPVPYELPVLRDPRVALLLRGEAKKLKMSPAELKVFYSAYHPDRLAVIGKRSWEYLAADTLFFLAPVQQLEAAARPSMASFVSLVALLSRDTLGKTLATEFKLPATANWDAYLGALEVVNGRRAALEFLVPILVREYNRRATHRVGEDALPQLQLDGSPPVVASPSVSLASTPPLAAPSAFSTPALPPLTLSAAPNSPEAPAPSSSGVPLEEQLRLATDFSPKRPHIRRMTPLEPGILTFENEDHAAEELLPTLSKLDIPFACHYGFWGQYVLDLPGAKPPYMVYSKRDSSGMARLVEQVVEKGTIRLERSKSHPHPSPLSLPPLRCRLPADPPALPASSLSASSSFVTSASSASPPLQPTGPSPLFTSPSPTTAAQPSPSAPQSAAQPAPGASSHATAIELVGTLFSRPVEAAATDDEVQRVFSGGMVSKDERQ